MVKREIGRISRHKRIRRKILGTAERPRLVIHRSHRNLVAQLVDDISQKTLFGVTTSAKDLRVKAEGGGNIKRAVLLGEIVAVRAKEKGVSRVVFDRGGYLYHGCIKAFAEAARKAGLEF